ncbi:hypothetical protein SAMD00019534_096840 [Acytostelium subglobosum LB1]|uniref:hypothetical protein n=1 Tax=Acytostelium subglobosum LB1 TaxID=1410327 RepID=UPI0006448039|nr:hypothetical protein SAMD00019534_096840 [Acytostelium subglobosum LB1]GAM26509.1 hypothetical protein SAMD00019534_096840 [Acytostelium subglobosum LB1]|eukprot:XP_012750605.1 hypothetical protein SAMD00019534_096840 [Acytostelium subglobosum LB1]
MYRACCSSIVKYNVSSLTRKAAPVTGLPARPYSSEGSGRKSKFLEFEDEGDLVIDTRKQEKKEEKIVEEQIDIDHMIANTTLKELKLMRWEDNYEGYELAKRENVDMHDVFVPEETTEEVLARIAAKQQAELKGSKFSSVKLSYNQVSDIKTQYIARLLNDFKTQFEAPLVQLFKDTINEANTIHRSANSKIRRELKQKLKGSAKRKLSGLESHFQDLLFVRNAINGALDKSAANPDMVNEAWNRLLTRSAITDPLNLSRDLIQDDYNDFGKDAELAEQYITQLTMIPFDFRNPKSYNSVIALIDEAIDSIGEDGMSPLNSAMSPEQQKFADSLDNLRTMVLELEPATLANYINETIIATRQIVDMPSSVRATRIKVAGLRSKAIETAIDKFDLGSDVMNDKISAIAKKKPEEMSKADFAELDRAEDEITKRMEDDSLNNIEDPYANIQAQLTTSERIDWELSLKYKRIIHDMERKFQVDQDMPVAKTITQAKNATDFLAMAAKQLTGIEYNEQKFLDIAFPEEELDENEEEKDDDDEDDVMPELDDDFDDEGEDINQEDMVNLEAEMIEREEDGLAFKNIAAPEFGESVPGAGGRDKSGKSLRNQHEEEGQQEDDDSEVYLSPEERAMLSISTKTLEKLKRRESFPDEDIPEDPAEPEPITNEQADAIMKEMIANDKDGAFKNMKSGISGLEQLNAELATKLSEKESGK